MHPDRKRFTHDHFVGNNSPVTAVVAVIPIITHHEVLPLTDAPLALAFRLSSSKCVKNHVFGIAQLLSQNLHRRQSRHEGCVHRFVIHKQLMIHVANQVARNANHSFNVVSTAIFRVAENHHVTTLRIVHLENFCTGHWQSQPIGILVDQNKISDLQCRQHGTGGNLEGLHQERPENQNNRQDREKRLAQFHQIRFVGLLVVFAGVAVNRTVGRFQDRSSLSEYQHIQQPDGTGCKRQYHEHEGKIDIHSDAF